jgi:hypothetical protein
VVDRMLRSDLTSYAGRYYQLQDAPMRPAPLQKPRPPLMLAAHKPKMLRIIAQFADTWNSFGTVDEMRERNEILDAQCALIGRDPTSIVRSIYVWAAALPMDPWSSLDAFEDMVQRYAAVGVNEFLVDQPPPEQLAMVERVATDLLPRLRATHR